MNATPLLAPFETLINRNLAASTPARAELVRLAGRSFAIEVGTAVGGRLLRVRLAARAEGLVVTSDEEPADASVSGTPLGLAALLAGRRAGRVSAAGVTVSGDAEVASAFEQLLKNARPDAEEELARLIGDAPAYYAARAARGALEWGRKALASLNRNVGEYLTEEGRDLVPRAELDAHHAEVDRVREDVDRAAARLALAAERLARLGR
ncbi:MAG TPA: SCP2 sterol-binding domain-containing protein [Steroidobacteraceae bacterium]|nr:SCP2 sterol-binding domain-containing protein [Steroidobacteraceae bacterium]